MGNLIHVHTTILCLLGVVTVTTLQSGDNNHDHNVINTLHSMHIILITTPFQAEHRKENTEVFSLKRTKVW